MIVKIVCQNCKAELSMLHRSLTCSQCSANVVEYEFHLDDSATPKIRTNEIGIWRFSDFLPNFSKTITLGEGQTPIRKALHIFKDKINLSLKTEGSNPTGSFLDRVSPLMVSDAISRKMHSLICATDGNLGASLSAYCAAAEIHCLCVVPKSISPEKRTQISAYGAEIIDYGETIDSSLSLAKSLTEEGKYQATPEFNILTIEGAKTISFEIAEQQGNKEGNPEFEYIIVPMGSGSLLYSIWKGFKQLKELRAFSKLKLPKIIGVQVEGFDPITKSFESGELLSSLKYREHGSSEVLADAILVRNPTFGEKAIQSIKESEGTAISVNEKEMVNASKMLATKEGIFAELSSATVIAAIEKLILEKILYKNSSVLAVITASGLKTSRAFQKSTTRDQKVESFRSMGTKVEILRIINSNEANFGYGIWKSLGQTISLQAVYQHLKELLLANHIAEIESIDRQKRYVLTVKGKKLIEKMKELEELLK